MADALPPAAAATLPGAILMVEDDLPMQARLARILAGLGCPAEALAIAASAGQAREAARQRPFALALVDIGLPDGNGIDLIGEWRAEGNPLSAIVISAWAQPDMIVKAIRAGATGYLLKEREDIELSLSIRSVFRGGAPIDPFVASHIMSELATGSPCQPQGQPGMLLSPRETEILALVAQGLSNQAIADQLHISRNTVECHIKSIYRKLEAPSRINAINKARRHGLI